MARPRPPHRLYVHIAWSTLARVEAIDAGRRAAIESHVMAGCRWLGAQPVEVCVLADRVHLLAGVPAVLSVHDLAAHIRDTVEELLSDSGRVVRWSPGFAAITVSPAEVRRVRRRLAALGLDDRAPSGRRSRPARPRPRVRLRPRRG